MTVNIADFPAIYCVTDTFTQEDLDQYKIKDMEPGQYVTYEFEQSHVRRLHSFERDLITRLAVKPGNGGSDSVVLRKHHDQDSVESYCDAIYDYVGADRDPELNGVFTLLQRPTKASWPGPLLIYVDGTIDNSRGDQNTAVAVTIDGQILPEGPDGFNW